MKTDSRLVLCTRIIWFLLVLRTKDEERAGFRQWDGFLLQLEVSHWSWSRTDGDFRLFFLIITCHVKKKKKHISLRYLNINFYQMYEWVVMKRKSKFKLELIRILMLYMVVTIGV